MNGDLAHPPAETGRSGGWSRQRLFFFIALALAAHLALIFIFGTRKPVVPRPVTNVPQLRLADSSSEAIALNDPTLFALPHVRDFGSPVWLKMPRIPQPSFRWTEPPKYLLPTADHPGAAIHEFMQTNRLSEFKLNFKPEPQFAGPGLSIAPTLPQDSTFKITGGLSKRPLLAHPALLSLPYDDVIQPSRVQVLVDPAGDVLSAVLLDSSKLDAADQQALDLALALRFAPAAQLTLGDIIFNWHTVPLSTTNAP